MLSIIFIVYFENLHSKDFLMSFVEKKTSSQSFLKHFNPLVNFHVDKKNLLHYRYIKKKEFDSLHSFSNCLFTSRT